MRKLSPRAVKWLTLQLDIRVRIHWSLIPELTPVLRATDVYHCPLARACPEAKRSDMSEIQGHLVRLESSYCIGWKKKCQESCLVSAKEDDLRRGRGKGTIINMGLCSPTLEPSVTNGLRKAIWDMCTQSGLQLRASRRTEWPQQSCRYIERANTTSKKTTNTYENGFHVTLLHFSHKGLSVS